MERPEIERVVGRLLGPAGPELGCDECFAELDHYVELELAGADADAAVPASGRISKGARPAARSTRACGRS